jgi:Spo0E like sporulation regulatory protein
MLECKKSNDRKEKRLMILKKALDLSKSITDYKRDMYKLAKNKGISDPDVIRISHKLDGQIVMLQKMIYTLRSSKTETSYYKDYKYS